MSSDDYLMKLRAKQRNGGYTDRDMASLIGVSLETWHSVRTGKREPSTRVLRGVARRWPELDFSLLSFLRSDVAEGNDDDG